MTTKLTQHLKPGRKAKHGGYALLTGHGIPEKRRYIESYLTAFRAAVVDDLGPGEENMTALEIMVLDRLVTLLGATRLIEEAALENPGQKLDGHYLSFNNAILRYTQALGISRKAIDERVMTMTEVVEKIEKEDRDKK